IAHSAETAGTATFDVADLGSPESVTRIWGTSASDVWAVTNRHIYRYTGATTDGGVAAFAIVPFPNDVQQLPGTEEIDSLWGRGSDLWISGKEFTDCSTNANSCCFFDDACDRRFVLAHWKGGSVAGPDASPASGPLAPGDGVVPANPALRKVPQVAPASRIPTDGIPYLLPWATPGPGTHLSRVSPAGVGLIDGSSTMDAGSYRWTLEE